LPDQAEPEMARDILEYFVRNPQAADSLEGIVRWRLLEIVVRRQIERAKAAVEWLVERGYLIDEGTASSGSIYRLNHRKKAEAQRLVGDVAEDG
jgi:hypothetical protein